MVPNFLFAIKFTASVVKPTTLMLLTGIRIAAISGVKCQVTAKPKAIAL